MPLSKNALYLLNQRYCRDGETPEGVFKRTAEYLAKGDTKFEELLFTSMVNGIFLPNSPALFNAGLEKPNLHACYILPVDDDLGSIFSTLTNMARIFKNGGGVGINFSKLREADSFLSGGGRSSGTISFMGLFDETVDIVKQGGRRRGALMGILNHNHPEIFNFIKVKLEKKLQNFNLSIMVTDDFMKKVDTNKQIDIISPKGYKVTEVKAKDIFELICFASWCNGDPALLFYDRINKDNPFYPEVIIDTCNPCFTGDTLVAVADSRNAVSFEILANEKKDVPVYCKNKNGNTTIKMMRNIRKTREKTKILKIILDDNTYIKCTENHIFLLSDGSEKKAIGLVQGDSLMRFDSYESNGYRQISSSKGLKRFYNHKVKSVEYYGIEDVYDGTVDDFHNFAIITSNIDKDFISSSGVFVHNCSEVAMPYYSACCLGSINMSKFIWKNSFNFDRFYEVVQSGMKALTNMNELSIYPMPEIADAMKKYNPVGLGIMGFADTLIKLGIKYDSQECLNFIDEVGKVYKQSTLDYNTDTFYFYRRIIAPTGSLSILADCFTGDTKVPLLNGTEENIKDLVGKEFSVYSYDIDNKKIECGKATAKKFKTVDTIMEITLDNNEVIHCTPDHKFLLREGVYKEASKLVEGQSLMPLYRKIDALANHKIISIKYLTGKYDTYCLIVEKYHNFALSAGVFVHNCSSGIEPVYDIAFERSLTIGKIEETRELYKSEFTRTAHQVSPEWHVNVLAKWQEYLDGGVSKTVNLPNTASVDDIKNIYKTAWKMGVKGITIYRDGSRNQVLTGTSTTNKFIPPISYAGKCSDETCIL